LRRQSDKTSGDGLQDGTNGIYSIRPPPGLSPPPGFGGSSTLTPPAMETEKNIDTPIYNIASLKSILYVDMTEKREEKHPVEFATSPERLPFSPTGSSVGTRDGLFTRHLDLDISQSSLLPIHRSRISFAPNARTSVARLEDASLPFSQTTVNSMTSDSVNAPLLINEGNQNGFDVMEFLDSILNEGGTFDDSEEQNMKEFMIGSASDTTPFRANPWASENKSRAAAYGISFDDDDDSISNGSSSTQRFEGHPVDRIAITEVDDSIPLLTPAAILNSTEEDGNGASLPISFLTSLVDG
jgi:hypothetical protein